MADSTKVLREYLLSLGFRIDQTGSKKFDDAIAKTGKGVMALGTTAVAAAAAVGAMVEAYATSMEKLYYMSRTSGTSVGQLKAMGQAAEKSGIGAEKMQGAVDGLAAAFRRTGGPNGGIARMIEGLGVQVKGRTPGDVLIDGLKMLKSMSDRGNYNQALGYAGAFFGLDQKTFDEMMMGLDKYQEEYAKARDLQAKTGNADDANAQAMVDFKNNLRDVGNLVDNLEGQFVRTFKEPIAAAVEGTKGILNNLAAIFKEIDDRHKRGASLGSSIGDTAKKMFEGATGMVLGTTSSAANSAAYTASFAEHLSSLDKKYGFEDGTMMALMGAESGGNRQAVSKTGAPGLFQMFKPAVADVGGDYAKYLSDDIAQADYGAAYLALQRKRYGSGTNLAAAVAAYHDGHFTNMDSVSPEGRDEIKRVQQNLSQHIVFNIHGGSTREVVEGTKAGLTNTNAQLAGNLRALGAR